MNNQTFKVSIITPMYQAENFIQRFIDMVLAFDYKNLELILINDASTDKTEDILNANKEAIKNAGIDLKYVKLEKNQGQAYAINEGLKFVTGEYMVWCDVDDIYVSDCISKLLNALINNPECKIAFSNSVMVKFDDLDTPVKKPRHQVEHKDILADCIFDKNLMNSPLHAMVETESLFKVLKNKSIYTTRTGQNLQIIMPMVERYKWTYVEDILSKYVLHPNSHSHSCDLKKRNKDLIDLFVHIFDDMEISKKRKIYYKVLTYYRFFLRDLNNILKININFKRKFIRIILFSHEIINTDWKK